MYSFHIFLSYLLAGGIFTPLTVALPSSIDPSCLKRDDCKYFSGDTGTDGTVSPQCSLEGEGCKYRRRASGINGTAGTNGTEGSGGRLVFAHFMMGTVSNRQTPADYDSDMKRAKSYGIDAFALNIGNDPHKQQQLDLAYKSAETNGMKVFISFDFASFSLDVATVGGLISEFGNRTAQLKVEGKVFVSSFLGDGLDVKQLREKAGVEIYFAPNFYPKKTASSEGIDAAFNWMAWNNDGNNKAPKPNANITVKQGDELYKGWLGDKPYIASVSPWFFTHYGPEVVYSKNFVFPSDLLWYQRWNEILTVQPRFVEIISWNDFGESHYIGPLASKHIDDGNSKWVKDMPHSGWLDMAKPFIAAYKAGSSSPTPFIEEDKLIYWYRPTPKTVNCDTTDTTMAPANNVSGCYFNGRPNGADAMEDKVFVVALLKEKGTVCATSGKNEKKSFEAPAGASSWSLDMGVGPQKFGLEREEKEVIGDTSQKDVSDTCPCGLYNYNAYVGTVPAGEPDVLCPEGSSALMKGLKVETC